MADRPRDPDCTCEWSPIEGRIWCQHCLTDGPLPGSLADPNADEAQRLATQLRNAEATLSLAHEFRVPLTNQAGGYGEVVVQRGEGPHRSRWAVTDGSVTLLHTWTGEDWQPVREIGATAAYRHTLDEALAVAHQVAEIEGVCTEAQANAIHPGL